MRRLSRFFSLEPKERMLLCKAAALLWAVRAGLWLLPFQTLRRMIERRAREQNVPGESAARIVWAVRAASRYVPRATCLTQSLAAYLLISRNGGSPRLHVGVMKEAAGRLSAHAWVVSDGTVVIGEGRDLSRYTELLRVERAEKVA